MWPAFLPRHHDLPEQQQSAEQAGSIAHQTSHAFSWRSMLSKDLLQISQPLSRCEMRSTTNMKRMVFMLGWEHALLTCTVRQIHLDRAAMGDQHNMPNSPAEVCFNAT